jgi:hypothetical protein
MERTKSLLEMILGTKTKVRMLEHLITTNQAISRHALSKALATGIGPVYKASDELIALGVLKEVDGKLEMDQDFPDINALTQLITSGRDYYGYLHYILRRIDRVFGDRYYLTGYLAACQNGSPIDHEQDTAMIAALDQDARLQRYQRTLCEASNTDLRWIKIKNIGRDVKRMNIYGNEIWIASFERGLVDSLAKGECGVYPVALLLLQSAFKNKIEWTYLAQLAAEAGMARVFGTALHEMATLDIEVPKEVLKGLPNGKDAETKKAVRDAYGTLRG